MAIRRTEREFLVLAKEQVEYDADCECENRLRYSLPCRHQLLPLQRGDLTAIPLGLVHPRWWLNGPPTPQEWQPSWGQRPLILSPKKTTIYSDLTEVMIEREGLTGEAQARFDRQITQATANLRRVAQSHRELEALPLGIPNEIPKRTWDRTKRAQNTRALTANELSERQQKKQWKEQARQINDHRILQERTEQLETQDTIVVAPRIQVSRTPTPPPATAPTRVQSPSIIASPSPPLSTAIPLQSEAPTKRARAASGYYAAMNSGDSQKAREKRVRN